MKNMKSLDTDSLRNKHRSIIDEMVKRAANSGLIDIDFVDQIPDNEINDEVVPLPYGSEVRDFDMWES